ncbi:probable RNA-dependent RNA polymerase 4 [Lycium barbarum]|uniref:probable RNA-dependent RNA polymerase 4 n=1 Tax=Lycium barbarum TaxID=112863 RepID=UPI00293ECF72|nr:probable RNA-dependent RNA polymerase 4 [Lycium barbarum]
MVIFVNIINGVQHLDWDSGKTHLYHCHVDSDGSYTFKGPYLKAERIHLQQSLGDENVLIVKFEENAPGCPEEIVQNGILVGLRRYRFFAGYRLSKAVAYYLLAVPCSFVSSWYTLHAQSKNIYSSFVFNICSMENFCFVIIIGLPTLLLFRILVICSSYVMKYLG